MANKPAVVLDIAGDEKKIVDSFDRAGRAGESFADKVDAASREAEKAGRRFDELAEKSDTVDTRAMGFRDTLTGLQDTMKGLSDPTLSFQDKLLTLGFGIGDLASGFTNVLFPAMASGAEFMRGPLSAAMTFISSHPLLITLGLLAAAVIFLISQTDWFQAVATRVFNWVGHLAQDVFGATIGWIVDRWTGLVDWFEHLPDRLGSALGSLGGILRDVFKGAINFLVEGLNWYVDHTLNFLIDRINDVTGVVGIPDIHHIPSIPKLHTGGVFHASGGEGLAMLRDGERVSAPGQGGGVVVRVTGSGALAEIIQGWFTDGTLIAESR